MTESVADKRHQSYAVLKDFAGFVGVLQQSHPALGPSVAALMDVADALQPEQGMTKEEQIEHLDDAIASANTLTAELLKSFDTVPWSDIQVQSYERTLEGIQNLANIIKEYQDRIKACLELADHLQSVGNIKTWLVGGSEQLTTILTDARELAANRDFDAHQKTKAEVEWSELEPDVAKLEAERDEKTEEN